MIDIQAAANARNARVQTSNETNPTFNFDQGSRASPLETAVYIGALGDVVNGNVNASWVVYFFGMICPRSYKADFLLELV